MKALITGSTGFVGPYLKKELESHGYEVFGLDRSNKNNVSGVFCGDITDTNFVKETIKEIKPDEVYHLAGFSSVKKSFDEPELAMKVNVDGTKNILLAVREFCPKTKVLIISSSDVYGNPKKNPVNEEEEVKETSPYSESRIAQEKLVEDFKDLNVVISRSFNHTGPGQPEIFVLPDFVKQVVEIEKGLKAPVIYTGDLNVVRDFSDVRDVVRAYYLLLQKGAKGEVYNVGSGNGYKIKTLLDKALSFSKKSIDIKQDQNKTRSVEILNIVADISKLQKTTGWTPNYSIDKTISDLLNYERSKF